MLKYERKMKYVYVLNPREEFEVKLIVRGSFDLDKVEAGLAKANLDFKLKDR